MFCKQCGKEVDESVTFCPQCGTKIEVAEESAEQPVLNAVNQPVNAEQPNVQSQPQPQPIFQNQPVQNPVVQTLGMNWYKFLIYFALFAAAVLNFSASLMYFTGEIYNMSGESVGSEWIYGFFPSLKGLDVFMGIVALVMCAGAIFVRFQLAKFKKNGPLFYFILIGVNIATSIIYMIASAVILADISNYTTTITISPSQIVGLITNFVILILNIIYFNKRKHLFVNP